MIKWLSFFLLFSYSCNTSSSVIPQKKMQIIIWDLIKADAFAQQIASKDSLKKVLEENKKLSAKIFEIHSITEDDFKTSYQYYSKHPDAFKSIFDSINAQQARITFTDTPNSKKIIFDSTKRLFKNKNE